jgi:hypothetical protein
MTSRQTFYRFLASLSLLAGTTMADTPKVILLIDEKSLGTIPTAEVEALATRLLLDQQVNVVDQDMIKANLQKTQQSLRNAGDNRGASALGQQFGADVIIIGEAVAKPSARRIGDSNLRTYQAVATLRAVRTDNSATIAASSEDASIVGLDDVAGSSKALKACGQKCLAVLIPSMLKAWTEKTAPSAAGKAVPVELTIGGVDQLWKLKAIRDRLRGMSESIQTSTQKQYSAGLALFNLESLISAEELSEKLVLNPPDGLKMQVLEITPGKINLKVTIVEKPQ